MSAEQCVGYRMECEVDLTGATNIIMGYAYRYEEKNRMPVDKIYLSPLLWHLYASDPVRGIKYAAEGNTLFGIPVGIDVGFGETPTFHLGGRTVNLPIGEIEPHIMEVPV